jgi:hypothetical protein
MTTGFRVYIVMIVHIVVFWVVTLCSTEVDISVLDKHVASIIRVEMSG